MKRNFASIIFIIILAILFRLPDLTHRPIHVDEAVNAFILGTLIESGTYEYNPGEYHGPSLYYFSVIFTKLAGRVSFAQLDEYIIRIIPVITGILVVILTLLIGRLIKPEVGYISGILVSVSPIMVYFNRYFIHESLLVALGLGVIFLGMKFFQNPRLHTSILLGLCIGLLIATKETWLIYMSVLVFSLVVLRFIEREYILPKKRYLAVIIIMTGITIILFFSSFLTDWQGLISFTEAFEKYFIRGTTTPEHTHSWYYYLRLIFFYNEGERWFISETPILILAIPGIITAIKNKSGMTGIFMTTYFFTFLILFSIIPYKTPWNILGLIPVMAILGAIGIWYLWENLKTGKYRSPFIVACLLLLVVLGHESWQINYLYPDAPENPYTYGHAREDVKKVSANLDELKNKYPGLTDIRIDVIAQKGSYWPLPWYLRHYNNVAWCETVPENIASIPIVLITPEMEPDFIRQIYEKTPFEKRKLFLPLYENDIELRPGVMIRGYIHKELWDKIMANHSEN